MTDPTQDDTRKMEQAKRAIAYALKRIRDDNRVAYFCGFGTEIFEQLTAAYAAISEQRVEDVRREFDCRDTRKPRWPKSDND